MDRDEKLIYSVQKYACLFNTKAKNYSDKNSKMHAWEKVSSEMKLSAADCQKRWKKLRDCYKKALKLRQYKYKNGSARKLEKPIKFEKELEFLNPFLQDRPLKSNMDCYEESLNPATENVSIDIENVSTLSSGSVVIENPRSDSLSEMLFRQYVEAKEKDEDPLDGFFLSMSRTVKRMPVRIQAELKRAILGLVTDAEIKLADSIVHSNSNYEISPNNEIIQKKEIDLGHDY